MYVPLITSRCYDCGLGCDTAGERFMVKNAVREEAWPLSQFKPWHAALGQRVLCVACFEQRIGRTLCADDFVSSAGVNDPNKQNISERLCQRLTATESHRLDAALPEKPKVQP
jgi:hypothetical protein